MSEWETEFERCRGWIEDALQYAGGTHTIDDIKQAIAEQRLVLWPGKRSAVVTEFVSTRNSRHSTTSLPAAT